MESHPRRELLPSCYTCSHNRKTEKATKQCKTCKITFCESCTTAHLNTVKNDHKIESLGEANQVSLLLPIMERSFASMDLSSRLPLLADPPITAYYVNDFSVRLPDDVNDCYVTGCLVFENKQAIIVDKNNMKLKLFDSNSKFLSSADTPNVTWGITKLSQNTFATCGCGNEVTLWELKDSNILQLKGIQVYDTAYGISSNIQFICTMHPDSDSLTLISNDSGKVIKHKQFFQPKKQRICFGFDLDMDEYFAYVGCGLGDKRIVAISLIFMSITWECRLPGNTCGVLDLRHQLLVTDMTNKKLVTVSKKGKILDSIISLEFMKGRPQYIGCSFTGRTLLVSQYGTDIITVFRIKLYER